MAVVIVAVAASVKIVIMAVVDTLRYVFFPVLRHHTMVT
jgi:hypothetical protein